MAIIRPVVTYIPYSGQGSATFIMAYNGNGSNILYTRTSTDDGITWQYDTGFYGNNPSLNQGGVTVLAYQGTNGIYFSEYGYYLGLPQLKTSTSIGAQNKSNKTTSPPQGYWGWSDVEFVPSSGAVSLLGYPLISNQSTSPQIAYDAYRTHISWMQKQVVNLGNNVTFYFAVHQPRNNSGGWGTAKAYVIYATTLAPPPIGTPTVSSSSTGSTVMLWGINETVYKATGDVNNVWTSSTQSLGSGRFPTLSYQPSISTQAYLSTQTVNNIYKINTNGFTLQKTSNTAIAHNYARVLSAIDTVTQQTISVYMTEPKVGGRKLAFTPVNDTLPGITADNFFDYFTSEQIQCLSNSDTIEFSLSITNSTPSDTNSNFDVILNGMNEKSKVNKLIELSINKEKNSTSIKIKRAIKNLRGKMLRLEPEKKHLPLSGKNWIFNFTHVYTPENSYETESKENLTEDFTYSTPVGFGLLDNYPNPFNPSTIINYQLPNVGTRFIVSLKVYDVLGREVATLVDGMKEAGYYTATFNGSCLASGIYFARLTALPKDGSQPFVQVMKMLMTK